MKKNTFHISSNGNMEIPYIFIPKGIMKYNALLNVTTESGLCFSYPLTVYIFILNFNNNYCKFIFINNLSLI